MDILPDELLGREIFSWLSDADWARCDRVCRRFHGLTDKASREDRFYAWKRRRRDGCLEMGRASVMAILLEDFYDDVYS